MRRFNPAFIGLRGLILIFVLLAVLATLCNSLIVAYGVQRDALVHFALEANRAYAFKVASTIDEFLTSVHARLAYSSQQIGRDFDNPQLLKAEATRLHAQDLELNAVLIVDAAGTIRQTHPDMPEFVGSFITSEELAKALASRKPDVSQAYRAASGRLIVFVSQPIFGPGGEYLGLVGGSVYLQQHGTLHNLIGEHKLDGTFAFVADGNRRLLYHPDHGRIGEVLSSSATVDTALHGETGAMQAVNYKGIPMLAGYAYVADANWAVVAQQPRDEALAPLGQLMRDMIVKIIPAGLAGLALILLGAMLITRPLRQLSAQVGHLAEPEAAARLQSVKAWYAEAASIRQALVSGVQLLQQHLGRLSHAADTDALTGLANRRAMDAALKALDASGKGYAALALDIDHFKRVNDTFGHDAGDVTLRRIAQIIQECSRTGDLACRAGGEEFCLLLPDTGMDAAREIAERIRSTIAATQIDPVGKLTISIGVARRGPDTPASDSILKRADERLYQAKAAGRNRVVADDAAA